MTNSHFVRKLHTSLEVGTFKRHLGEFLESRKVEILIITLVLCDLVLLLIEGGIDAGVVCINGIESEVPPGDLVKMGETSLLQLGSLHAGSEWRPWASHRDPWSGILGHGLTAGFMSLALRNDGSGLGPLAFFQTNATELDYPTYYHSKSAVNMNGKLRPRSFHAVSDDTILAHPVHADGRKYQDPPASQSMKEVRHMKVAHHEMLRAHQSHEEESAAHDEGEHEKSHGAHEEGHGEEAHGGHGAHGHGHHSGSLVCEDEHGPMTHELIHFCHTASITILCIFLIEILAKFWINPKEFVRSPVELLDLTVVTLSLIVDVFILPMVHDPKQKAELHVVEILLVFCRGWRVVRIFHGIFEIVHHEREEEEKLERQIEEMARTIAEQNREDPEEVRERYAMLAKSRHSH